MKTLGVGLGGALGSIARYHLDGWIQQRFGTAFPYGTLTIHLLGSFLLALLMYIGLHPEITASTARAALAVGVLGGFTTYSTFNFDTLRYLQSDALGVAVLNIAATVLGGLAAGLLGWTAGRASVGA
jgi:fluoride exporter